MKRIFFIFKNRRKKVLHDNGDLRLRSKPAGEHVTIIPPFAEVQYNTYVVYNRTGFLAEAAVVRMRHTVTVWSYFFLLSR